MILAFTFGLLSFGEYQEFRTAALVSAAPLAILVYCLRRCALPARLCETLEYVCVGAIQQ